ncbi:hypothetical protein BH23CYA1_BH23CYA1_21190 [soil metagenome]|uniref:glycosyltransferase n=1 Tax=Leptolyngbya sp. BC1307 TaxID=2029589 RepID=UPI000EFB0D20|nr:glycosyltransferase family 2 protein [Leptolyngbya sp. BC1307]
MLTGARCPFVSVIIPVFNDGERLKLCLTALAHQSYGLENFEIIVVDNGSNELELIKTTVLPYSNVTLAFEPTPGSYAARNTGLSLAKGEAIAFTDADCIPALDWLEKGIKRLLDTPNCGLVSGKIEIFPKDASCPTAVELFELTTAFPQAEHLEQMKYGATANLFTWDSVVQKVGNFDETLKSGGDLDWGIRVYEAGYQQVYAEEVRLKHPARFSFKEIRQKTIRLAGGHYDLLERGLYHFFHRHTLLFTLTEQKFLPKSLLKEIIFLIILMQDLIPPINYVKTSCRSPKLTTWSEKSKVAWVIFRIRYISAWAKLHLKFGQVSIRY